MLLLMDRSADLSVMFHHTWTYQAMVHDLLDMKLNTIRLQQEVEVEGQPAGRLETKTYDLDPASDAFWLANAGHPWPKVVGMTFAPKNRRPTLCACSGLMPPSCS